jgi:multicomponent Na+:H+ antiporter subunit D
VSGAIFYVVHHITVQTTLFLVAGLIERRGGSTSLDRLGGLARVSPLLAVLYFVPALNLAGIPPFSGFIGKLGLLQAGVDSGGALAYALVAGGALTSLLTLYATARVWNQAFWRAPHPAMPRPAEDAEDDDAEEVVAPTTLLPRMMLAPTVALVTLGAALTLVAGPLSGLSADAAADLLRRTTYIDAVFPAGTP